MISRTIFWRKSCAIIVMISRISLWSQNFTESSWSQNVNRSLRLGGIVAEKFDVCVWDRGRCLLLLRLSICNLGKELRYTGQRLHRLSLDTQRV